MTRRPMWVSLLVVVLLSVGLAQTQAAYACTPPVGGPVRYSVDERTQAAEVVLVGTVQGVGDASQGPYAATVMVEQYLKGYGPAVVVISNFGSSAMCLSEVAIGQRALFFTTGSQPARGLTAHYRGQFDAVEEASADTILEASTAAGVPAATPIVMPTEVDAYPASGLFDEGRWVNYALVVIALGVAWVVWRARAKPKGASGSR